MYKISWLKVIVGIITVGLIGACVLSCIMTVRGWW